ncbi:MAG: aspartyl protease family protein [Candidatus Thorarchaeota archaeon]|jgi:predicted aspartyl protease
MQMKIQLGEGSGHPHVPVMINGKGPFTFVLDTGASMTTISLSLAEQLGISTYEGDKKKARGVGGNEVPIQTAMLESIGIGPLHLQNEEVGVLDFANVLGSTGCGPTAGVIGHTTLKNYRVRVDYESLLFGLEESNGNISSDSLEWVPFKYLMDTHLIGVPVYINGKGPIDHVLDTGSSGNVMTPSVAHQLGISDQLPEGTAEATGCSGGECVGVGGRVMGYGAMVSSLSIGSAELSDTIMGVIDLGVISPEGKKIDYGIIGYPFLKDYELVIDYPQQRLALVNRN